MTDTFSDFVKANCGAFIWPVVSLIFYMIGYGQRRAGNKLGSRPNRHVSCFRVRAFKQSKVEVGSSNRRRYGNGPLCEKKAFMRHIKTGLFEPRVKLESFEES